MLRCLTFLRWLPVLGWLLLTLTGSALGQSASSVVLSGTLRDEATGEPLVGATVYIAALGRGTAADERGAYALELPPGRHVLTYSFVGYTPREQALTLTANLRWDLGLRPVAVQTGEVVVQARRSDANVQSTEMGVSRLELKTVRLMPALLGEVDVVRSLLLLSGVATVGEGAAGFNVRGGGIDQNLILLDDAPLYGYSHLFGLFSVFNPDAVRDLTLVKGGIPASYGGRLSSLLDVRLKEGDRRQRRVTGGLGLLSSRLAVEGPLVKDRASFIVAGRRSYGDLLLKLLPSQRDNAAYFYDLTVKASGQLGTRNRVFPSAYLGRDVFNLGQSFRNTFGNRFVTTGWQHTFTPRLVSTATVTASQYDYRLAVPSGYNGFDWFSRIVSYGGKLDLEYQAGEGSTWRFGAGALHYAVEPSTVQPTDPASIFRPRKLAEQQAREYAVYLDHDWRPTPRLSLRYGLRLSASDYLGAGTVYEYTGPDGRQKTPVNPRRYAAGEVIARYANPEPRAALRYALTATSSLKASYTRQAQYLHLISNTTASSPLDVWTQSTNNTRPARADQLTLGYFRNFQDNAYEASLEVYGKRLDNQVDYIDGANVLLNENLEADLLYGHGRAYGAELFVRKNTGALTGWLSYTMSRSERRVNGLNNGRWYVTKFDKPHNLALVGLYALAPRWTVSGTFNYSTGIATTVPDARFEHQGLIVPNTNGGVRNNYRVPAYHRLDLSATLRSRQGRGPRWAPAWESNWVFSLYNVYARRNAYSISFRQTPDRAAGTEAVRLSVFGTVIPALTYNFSF